MGEDGFVMLRTTLIAVSALAVSAAASAQSKTFKLGPNDAQHLATVESDTALENFIGRTQKVSGTLTFDPAKKTGSATLTVDLASIETGISVRDDHMRSEGWLNTAKFPEAKLVTTKVKHLKGDEYEVTGNLTLHGVTKTVKTKAKVRYMAESDLTKSKGFKGDILNFQGKVNIKLADYGISIMPIAQGKVAETVTIGISAVATTGN